MDGACSGGHLSARAARPHILDSGRRSAHEPTADHPGAIAEAVVPHAFVHLAGPVPGDARSADNRIILDGGGSRVVGIRGNINARACVRTGFRGYAEAQLGAKGGFIADGSLLPTAPRVNPQERIFALSTIVSERVASRFKAG